MAAGYWFHLLAALLSSELGLAAGGKAWGGNYFDCDISKNLVCTETRCGCLDATILKNKTGRPRCLAPDAFLGDPCGDLALVEDGAPRVCSSGSNLECDPVPEQDSVCQCKEGMIPNEYTKTCRPPPRMIDFGGACRENATEEEEVCMGEYSVCQGGICTCDPDVGNVLVDKEHKDCYLKTHPRHGRAGSGAGGLKKNDFFQIRLDILLLIYFLISINFT